MSSNSSTVKKKGLRGREGGKKEGRKDGRKAKINLNKQKEIINIRIESSKTESMKTIGKKNQ
jgi:hypothetical protein